MGIKTLFTIGIALLLTAKGVADEYELSRIQRAIEQKNVHWIAGVTSLSGLSDEEKKALCGLLPPDGIREKHELNVLPTSDTVFDWRNRFSKNWMTPVKDQRQCGSCWAFGALGALESMIKIDCDAPDVDVDLSEQYLVCCCHPLGLGCSGYSLDGTADWLFNHGVPDEQCYPYMARDSSSGVYCTDRCTDWEYSLRKVEEWSWIPLDSAKHYLHYGPLYVGMTVYSDFFSYRTGVYEHVWGDLEGYHAVTLLGWNDSDSSWICKNSWGKGWGEDGWFRIRWGECLWDDAVAMTAADATYPELVPVSDSIAEDDGDRDGVLNPGEQFTVIVTLQNIGDTAREVTGILRSEDPRVTLLDSVQNYGDMSPRAIVSNSHPFRLIAGADVGKVPLRLALEANESGQDPYSTTVEFDVEITLNQAGWPISTGAIESSPAILDIDGDGKREIIVGCNDGNLHVKNADGTDKENFPIAIGGRLAGSPAVGDVDGNGGLEIVIGSWEGQIYVIRSDGTVLEKILTDSRFLATPVLSDIDDDGRLDIVIGDLAGRLHVFRQNGSEFPNFPYMTDAPITNGAAVRDLDADGTGDIVFGNTSNVVYAVSGNGSLLWRFPTNGGIRAEPSIADINGIRIAVGCLDKNLYILDREGQEIAHIPTPTGIRTSPSFVDFDGKGDLEIVFTSGNHLYVCDEEGSQLAEWPKRLDSYASSPCFSDLNGDGEPEVVVTTSSGSIYVYKTDGSCLPPFPFSTENQTQSSPAIADLDIDGNSEILFGATSALHAIDVKSLREDGVYWSMHRGNPRRTGNHGDLFTSVSENHFSQSPRTYSLSQNHPNPFNPPTTIAYTLPEACQVKFVIFNILGEKVKTLVNRWEEKGHKIVTWDGRDDKYAKVAAGVYFYRIETSDYVATRKMVITF